MNAQVDIRACSAGNITQETFMGQVQIGIFHLYKHNNLLEPHKQDSAGMVRVVPDGEESSVSSPIRSIKMYSYLQYVLCKRNQCVVEMYPDWPMWSRDLTPSTPQGTRHICLATGDLFYQKLSTRIDLNSAMDICKQPNPEPVALGECM